jgi:hypothetical protein
VTRQGPARTLPGRRDLRRRAAELLGLRLGRALLHPRDHHRLR